MVIILRVPILDFYGVHRWTNKLERFDTSIRRLSVGCM